MRKKYPYLSQLSEVQRSNLAWRIDNYTGVGYITAIKIATLKRGDRPLNEVLELCGMTPHAAKIQATKIIKFKIK